MMRTIQTRLRRARLACIVILLLFAGTTWAHKGSDAYLDVQQLDVAAAPIFRLTLSVAIKDLDLVLPIDGNADGKVTWAEVKTAMPQVLQLINQAANSPTCRMDWKTDGVERRSDGAYLRFLAEVHCQNGQALALKYTLFGAQDATHRLLVAGRVGGQDLLTTASPQQVGSILLSPASGVRTMIAADAAEAAHAPPPNWWSALRDYFGLGVHHLLEGYDHLAFLLALVLPLQLSLWRTKSPQNAGSGQVSHGARPGGRAVWLALLRTITAFTIGHSITLILATLGLTQASPVWVEPVIALSIAVTAFLNLRPLPWLRVEVLALLFGMVHGFGFAGLLLEAAAPTGLLPWALAGFNLGVEGGQLIAVSGWVLLSQPLVTRPWYQAVVVRGGSVLLIGVATWWFWQRVS